MSLADVPCQRSRTAVSHGSTASHSSVLRNLRLFVWVVVVVMVVWVGGCVGGRR
jgi:hypothetical protein